MVGNHIQFENFSFRLCVVIFFYADKPKCFFSLSRDFLPKFHTICWNLSLRIEKFFYILN